MVEDPQLLDGQLKADYYLLLGQAKNTLNASLYGDSTLNEPVRYYSAKGGNDKKLAQSYYLRSKARFDLNKEVGDSEGALLDLLKAREHADTEKDSSLLGYIYYDIGDIYQVKYYFSEALANYRVALSYFGNRDNSFNKVLVYGKMGSIFNINQRPDSALFYQQRALDHMLLTNDSSRFHASILSALYKNIASSHRLLGDVDAQKNGFVKAYELLPEKGGTDANILIHLIAKSYISLNKPDSAYYYAQMYTEIPDETLKESAFRFHHWAIIYEKMGRFDLAIGYLNSYVKAIDKIYGEELSQSIYEAQQKYEKEALENQYNRVLVQRLYLVVVVAVFLLVGVVVSWYFISKIRKKERELLEAEQAIQTFSQLLGKQNQQDERLASFLVDKLDLTRKVAQMNVVATENTTDFIKQYHKIFGKNLMDEISWDNIYPVINDLYGGFVAKVEAQYPNLTDKELQLCCFIRAEFKTEEVAVLLSYTQSTVRVKKSRLARKMGFVDYDTFATYIMSL